MTLPSFVASSTVDMGAGGNGTSVVLTRPSAWVSGDTAYVGIYKENSAAITAPSGWVELSGSPFAAGTSFWAHVFRKILGGSEPSTYTWSWTGLVWREGVGLSVTNTDQTTPENQVSGQNNASSQTITAPAVTPTVSNTLLVVLGFYFNDGSYTSNTGMTERVDFGSRAITMATETGPASGVSSGTNTFTASASASVNVGVSIAVQEVQSSSTTGTIAANLTPLSMAASGTETFTGTLAANLTALSMAATGAIGLTGPLAANLTPLSMSAAGTVSSGTMGILTANLTGLSAAASGTEQFIGTVAANLTALSAAATGTESITGAIAASLTRLAASAAGNTVVAARATRSTITAVPDVFSTVGFHMRPRGRSAVSRQTNHTEGIE